MSSLVGKLAGFSFFLSRSDLSQSSSVADPDPGFGVGWSRKWIFLLTRNSEVAVSTKIRLITRNYGVIKPSNA
jgi:hypothetical protein